MGEGGNCGQSPFWIAAFCSCLVELFPCFFLHFLTRWYLYEASVEPHKLRSTTIFTGPFQLWRSCTGEPKKAVWSFPCGSSVPCQPPYGQGAWDRKPTSCEGHSRATPKPFVYFFDVAFQLVVFQFFKIYFSLFLQGSNTVGSQLGFLDHQRLAAARQGFFSRVLQEQLPGASQPCPAPSEVLTGNKSAAVSTPLVSPREAIKHQAQLWLGEDDEFSEAN